MTIQDIKAQRNKILSQYTVEYATWYPEAIALRLEILDTFLSVTTKQHATRS